MQNENYDDEPEDYGLGGTSTITPEEEAANFRRLRIEHGWIPDNPTEEDKKIIESCKRGEFIPADTEKQCDYWELRIANGWIPDSDESKAYVEEMVGHPIDVPVKSE